MFTVHQVANRQVARRNNQASTYTRVMKDGVWGLFRPVGLSSKEPSKTDVLLRHAIRHASPRGLTGAALACVNLPDEDSMAAEASVAGYKFEQMTHPRSAKASRSFSHTW